MDIVNLWKTTGDKRTDGINIIKTWLCGGTDGQTYSVKDSILDIDVNKIREMGYEYEFPEDAFDGILGFKNDYNVDDEYLDGIASKIYQELIDLSKDIMENPSKYFNEKKNLSICNAIRGISCDYCVEDTICTIVGECPFKVNL